MKHNTIIVGYDGSEASAGAVREAARIAEWEDDKLVVMEVIYDELIGELCRQTGLPAKDILAGRNARLGRELRTLLGEPLPNLDHLVIMGHPFCELVAATEKHQASLLVLGATGTTQIEGRQIGSVATSAVRHAPCEVLLVRGPAESGFKRVVCGIDFSENSARAIGEASSIAQQDGAKLHLAAIYAPDWKRFALESGGEINVPEEASERYHRQLEEQLSDFVYEHLEEIEHMDVQVDAVESITAPVGLCQYAEKIGADLVVIGTKGRSSEGLRPAGSTAEHVIRDAHCSVLAVKPEGSLYEGVTEGRR